MLNEIIRNLKETIPDAFVNVSPHFPSTEKDKDYTEGELTISLTNLNYSVKEIVTEGLRTVIALTNYVNLPVDIINIESPPGVSSGLKMQGSGYSSFSIRESERIPYLWSKYQKVLGNNHQELAYSIQWFMKAIKAEDPTDKFIYSWITFNSLYGWLAQSRSHVKGMKGLIGKGIPNLNRKREIVTENKMILEGLSQMNLMDIIHNIDHAANLVGALQRQDALEILIGAIEAIGFIRHNIFHGSQSNRTAEAERCIWPLIHLNAEVIKHQLEKI